MIIHYLDIDVLSRYPLTMDRIDRELLIDDVAGDDLRSALCTAWRPFSDRVMGGVTCTTSTGYQEGHTRAFSRRASVRGGLR